MGQAEIFHCNPFILITLDTLPSHIMKNLKLPMTSKLEIEDKILYDDASTIGY